MDLRLDSLLPWRRHTDGRSRGRTLATYDQDSWKEEEGRGKISGLKNCEEQELLEDFLASAEGLWRKLKRLLKACEEHMWKPLKKDGGVKMGKESGRKFVDTIFGRNRKLDATETLMQAMRLWIMRFEANCENVLKAARPRERRVRKNE